MSIARRTASPSVALKVLNFPPLFIMSTALTLSQDQIEKLKHETPKDFIQFKPGRGGKSLSYVDIGYVTAKLNQIFGHIWSFEVVREGREGAHIWVLGRLKVLLENGLVISKEQYGSADVKVLKNTGKPVCLGDDFKAAASDAMKKCASMLGLASDVYHPNVWKTTSALKKQLGSEPAPPATQ